MVKLESLLYFLEDAFQTSSHPDYPGAVNGLQVEGRTEVRHLGAAVDASEETIQEAIRRGVDLLLVHHGLFWGGLKPLTGSHFRKVAPLIRDEVGIYSLHLPLDSHPEFGNNALLLSALGLNREGRFGVFKEIQVGWWGTDGCLRDDLLQRLEKTVEGPCRLIPGGPERVDKVGVVTGGGASTLGEASAMGLDALITGEAPHHSYHEAMEFGVNLFLGGHYATETFGVKALASHLADHFGISWEFLHFPTGL